MLEAVSDHTEFAVWQKEADTCTNRDKEVLSVCDTGTHGHQKGKGLGINQDFGISRYALLYIKQIHRVLLQSPGNYIQCIYIYISESLC